ncbi:reverse transcriptase [Caerostris extrusa]|uniref:Reverse transcriptase n=1 Tax=Caerostris extrusa TaxID=172846 RepID=A0AAV4XRV5_CAEEX|nr:reverse transcriptase [Caerostris extrusa]
MRLRPVGRSTGYQFDFLDQDIICGVIPRIPKGPLLKELKGHRIWISDMGDDYPEIELLIGSDIYGQILTGEVIQLNEGLTAINTKLGWTLCGEPKELNVQNLEGAQSMLITNLHVQNMKASDMWDLERIGITDEVQTFSKAVEDQEKATGVTSDIRRAFLQIGINREDQNYLKFLWWENNKIVEFRHKRVVFGVTSSPYLLAAVISFHLKNVHAKFKVVAEKLLHAFYVDNCVTSVDTNVELEVFIQQATAIMADAKMELRMWSFGPEQELSLQNVEPISPVLGLQWDRIEDSLFIPFKSEPISNLSKRKLLSIEAWTTEANWDLPLPDELQSRFSTWYHGLSCISQLKFERRIGYGKRDSWSLHIFCDASKNAYATLIFLRSESSGQVYVKFVAAKITHISIKEEQKKHFQEKENSVHGLQVVRGDDDVLRVKTRIIERDDDLSFLYPILLPSKHYLTECLIREYNLKYCHAGMQILAAKLRLQYWIFSSKRNMRSCVSCCVVCKRFTAKALTTPPIQLPLDRVRESPIFEITGLDLCGPLLLKPRGKAWIVLFTCAVYMAIHLEPLTSLSTESFMQALRRFIAR